MQNAALSPVNSKKDFIPVSVKVGFRFCPNQIAAQAQPLRTSLGKIWFQSFNFIVARFVIEKGVVVTQSRSSSERSENLCVE